MAFDYANLTPKAYPNGVPSFGLIWDYSTSDNIATVEAGGYFNGAQKSLRFGDIIRVTANDGKSLFSVDGLALSGSSAGITKLASVSSFTTL